MAASGFTPISLYYSTTASAVPTSGNLANGELGLNIADMKLYAKNSAGTVTLLASNAGASGSVTSVSGTGTVNGLTLTGTVTTSGSLTLGGTLSLVSPPAIGSTTPNTGAFTTLSATGLSSLVATNINAGGDLSILNIGNTAIPANNLRLGWNNATGFGYIRTVGTWSLYLGSNSTNIVAIDTTGLAVTGLITATGTITGVNELRAYRTENSSYYSNLITNYSDVTTTQITTLGVVKFQAGATNDTNLYSGASTNIAFFPAGTERFRFAPAGQLGIGGANYGTAGQVLTSGGASAAPTWTTLAAGGGSFTAKTTTYTAASGDNILANTSAGSWTLTLPASPSTGNSVQVMDSIGTFGTYPLTVARNGSTIMSAAEDMSLAVNGAATTFVYNGSTWRVI
jgi:hypothetical protein